MKSLHQARPCNSAHQVAIQREALSRIRGMASPIGSARAAKETFGGMRITRCQALPPGSPPTSPCACEVGRGGVGHSIEHPGPRASSPIGSAPRRIADRAPPRARTADRLRIDIAGIRPEPNSTPAENVIQRIEMLGRLGRLGDHQLNVQCGCDTAHNLVLQGEEVDGAVEALGPQVRVGLGVDQLGVDPHLIADPCARSPPARSARSGRGRFAECLPACLDR